MIEEDNQAFAVIKSEHAWAKKVIQLDPKARDHLIGKELFEKNETLIGFVDSQAMEIQMLKEILCDDLHYWNAFRDEAGTIHVSRGKTK